MNMIRLNNGVMMPDFGLGTFHSTDEKECAEAVRAAVKCGYRMIDTARIYCNEEIIGRALESLFREGLRREDIFIVTKVWFDDYEDTRSAVMRSLERLGLEQADLVLLHWPFGNYYKAWRELEEIYDEGKLTRAIGVSNFSAAQIVDLVKFNRIVPAVNQIETNLISQQQECREWMRRYGIAHMGYGPFVRDKMPQIYEDSRLTAMASKYGKSPRQVTLRFLHQEGVILIPKSVHTERIAENMDIFDFKLTDDDMEVLRTFDRNTPMTGAVQNPARVAKILGETH